LDALRAPEDLQKADAVDRTGRTRNPHDDLLHGQSILETPHWRKAAPLWFKPSILRSACEGLSNHHAKASTAEFSWRAANRRSTWRHFLRVFSAGIIAWSGIVKEQKSRPGGGSEDGIVVNPIAALPRRAVRSTTWVPGLQSGRLVRVPPRFSLPALPFRGRRR